MVTAAPHPGASTASREWLAKLELPARRATDGLKHDLKYLPILSGTQLSVLVWTKDGDHSASLEDWRIVVKNNFQSAPDNHGSGWVSQGYELLDVEFSVMEVSDHSKFYPALEIHRALKAIQFTQSPADAAPQETLQQPTAACHISVAAGFQSAAAQQYQQQVHSGWSNAAHSASPDHSPAEWRN